MQWVKFGENPRDVYYCMVVLRSLIEFYSNDALFTTKMTRNSSIKSRNRRTTKLKFALSLSKIETVTASPIDICHYVLRWRLAVWSCQQLIDTGLLWIINFRKFKKPIGYESLVPFYFHSFTIPQTNILASVTMMCFKVEEMIGYLQCVASLWASNFMLLFRFAKLKLFLHEIDIVPFRL